MRWLKFVTLALVIALGSSSCHSSKQSEVPVISVSLLPEKYFVERMAGDLAEVHVVVPKGSNPETYDPVPRDIAILQSSRAYFAIGTLPFEERWLESLPDSVEVINIAQRMPLDIVAESHEGHSHLHGHSMDDPHYWTSLEGGTAMAEVIRDALVDLFPEHQAQIEVNYQQKIVPELEQLRQIGAEIFTDRDSLAFVIYHPSLSLFAHEWGLTQLVIEEGGKEPSARQLVELMERARQLDTKVVLIQAEFDQKNGETVARELKLPAVTIHPLEEDWTEEMRRIMELFR